MLFVTPEQKNFTGVVHTYEIVYLKQGGHLGIRYPDR